MCTFDPVSGCSKKGKSREIPRCLLRLPYWILRTNRPSATIDRLFSSQHVQDLRLIVVVALGTVLPVAAAMLALACDMDTHHKFGPILAKFMTFLTPVLGVLGAVLAWAYQTGSTRLGTVDLFACEMDTICRVFLATGSVARTIGVFERGLQSPGRHFTSEENYFPVFENNTRDLQALEADVVVNITAFYTYMKATRDSTRTLLDISGSAPQAPQPAPRPGDEAVLSPLQEAARNVIYMMFLGLEGARKATAYLVEFEPERIERAMVILLSELAAYRFLLDRVPEGVLHKRLVLRKDVYEMIVPALCGIVKDGIAGKFAPSTGPSEWEPASRLTKELSDELGEIASWSRQPDRRAATA